MKAYAFVEGHGEVDAAENLINRLWKNLALPHLPWARPIRWRGLNSEKGLRRACQYARGFDDLAALLILRDEDDACPKLTAPAQAEVIESMNLPFPTALVLLHREYEVLFLASLPSIAGQALGPRGRERPGVRAGTVFTGDLEGIRAVKEWLSDHFGEGKRYKPTLDQLLMTRMIDFRLVRRSELPCFGSLERALQFLAFNQGSHAVYPVVEGGRGA